MFNRIRVVHIAVKNMEEAARDYADTFGLEVSRSGDSPDMGIKNAILPIGDAVIELIEPLDPHEGALARFLSNRGEGIYMVGVEVENLATAIEELRAKGVRLTNADPESRARGVPVFVHPKSAHGVLIELIEKAQS